MSSNIESLVDRAENYCRQNGSRLTSKRKQVLSALLGSKKALSAYELIDVHEQLFDDKLAATSMYRILDFLREEHLVHKLDLANKYVACSHIACGHECVASQFLICTQCQIVKEVSVSQPTVGELKSTIEEAGFQLASTQLEINCICDRCARDAA